MTKKMGRYLKRLDRIATELRSLETAMTFDPDFRSAKVVEGVSDCGTYVFKTISMLEKYAKRAK